MTPQTHLDDFLTILFLLMPIFFALICLYYAFYFLKSARHIEDAPTSKIRSAAQGYVELKGIAKASTEITLGKLTRKPCAWYRYTIELYQTTPSTSSDNRAVWLLIDQNVSLNAFLLQDETGECIIEPYKAQVIPLRYTTWRGHSAEPKPPYTSFWDWLWNSWGRYRYTEYRLELNEALYAAGFFKSSETGQHTLSQKGLSNDQTFILSALSESKLIARFKLKAFIFFLATLFFTVISTSNTYPVIQKALKGINSPLLP